MASPKSSGRMIRRAVAESEKIPLLSPEAAVLFFMLIPHYSSHGKMKGGPGHIKDEVCPFIPYLTYDSIPGYLQEISDKTSVKWFRHGGHWWLHSLHFLTEHQDLRADRLGRDELPDYAGSSPGLVPELPSRAEVRKKDKEKRRKEKNMPALGKKEQKATATPPATDQKEAGGLSGFAGETVCTQKIRQVVEEKRPRLLTLFPHANIDAETERLCQKYRDGPVLDVGLLVLTWFQKIPVAKGIRAQMAAMSFDDIKAHDNAVAAEFIGQGAGDG